MESIMAAGKAAASSAAAAATSAAAGASAAVSESLPAPSPSQSSKKKVDMDSVFKSALFNDDIEAATAPSNDDAVAGGWLAGLGTALSRPSSILPGDDSGEVAYEQGGYINSALGSLKGSFEAMPFGHKEEERSTVGSLSRTQV
eukprot:SAG11_NODE_2388_length_3416_cov_2.842327_2_plen_144_part_00